MRVDRQLILGREQQFFIHKDCMRVVWCKYTPRCRCFCERLCGTRTGDQIWPGGRIKQWNKEQVWPYFGCCTADSPTYISCSTTACLFLFYIAWAEYTQPLGEKYAPVKAIFPGSENCNLNFGHLSEDCVVGHTISHNNAGKLPMRTSLFQGECHKVHRVR